MHRFLYGFNWHVLLILTVLIAGIQMIFACVCVRCACVKCVAWTLMMCRHGNVLFRCETLLLPNKYAPHTLRTTCICLRTLPEIMWASVPWCCLVHRCDEIRFDGLVPEPNPTLCRPLGDWLSRGKIRLCLASYPFLLRSTVCVFVYLCLWV